MFNQICGKSKSLVRQYSGKTRIISPRGLYSGTTWRNTWFHFSVGRNDDGGLGIRYDSSGFSRMFLSSGDFGCPSWLFGIYPYPGFSISKLTLALPPFSASHGECSLVVKLDHLRVRGDNVTECERKNLNSPRLTEVVDTMDFTQSIRRETPIQTFKSLHADYP